ncbi:hypothetical protein ACUXV3_12335 [Roseobacteraceae bacterium NS-SX3]
MSFHVVVTLEVGSRGGITDLTKAGDSRENPDDDAIGRSDGIGRGGDMGVGEISRLTAQTLFGLKGSIPGV